MIGDYESCIVLNLCCGKRTIRIRRNDRFRILEVFPHPVLQGRATVKLDDSEIRLRAITLHDPLCRVPLELGADRGVECEGCVLRSIPVVDGEVARGLISGPDVASDLVATVDREAIQFEWVRWVPFVPSEDVTGNCSVDEVDIMGRPTCQYVRAGPAIDTNPRRTVPGFRVAFPWEWGWDYPVSENPAEHRQT